MDEWNRIRQSYRTTESPVVVVVPPSDDAPSEEAEPYLGVAPRPVSPEVLEQQPQEQGAARSTLHNQLLSGWSRDSTELLTDWPVEYLDPILLEPMIDPVRTVVGCVYDRSAIVSWLSRKPADEVASDPLTNLPLPDRTLTPDDNLRQEILQFRRTKAQEGER